MNSSLTDYIADITYGINYDYWDGKDYFQDYESPRWLSILGYNGYLIGNNNGIDDEGKPLYDYASTISGSPDAALDVYEVGNISYYDFALGYSYDDKFYFGATLALATLECRLNGGSYYSETFSNGDGFTLENFLSTEGTGAQIKLGIIYRPIDEIRLGISWHSPTWYSMTDYFSAGILQKNNQYRNVFTPKSTFDYNFRSSGLWTFSWAAVLGSNAIISVDYELKDYGYSRFYDDNYNPSYDNKLIKDGYRWAQTLRTGLEYRFTSQFSGRLGYAWKQSGIKDEIADGQTEIITSGTIPNYTIDGNTTYLTTGIGYKFTPQFYVDFAYVHRIQKDDVYFYSPRFYEPLVASTPVTLKNNVSKYLLTLGYKF
ncbi:MAG: outer membrane protein transport protein [Dysgonamonadaceae bacterium]|nr:outer membrane protein transport protein [Dysgonamonadaceae bacterium]